MCKENRLFKPILSKEKDTNIQDIQNIIMNYYRQYCTALIPYNNNGDKLRSQLLLMEYALLPFVSDTKRYLYVVDKKNYHQMEHDLTEIAHEYQIETLYYAEEDSCYKELMFSIENSLKVVTAAPPIECSKLMRDKGMHCCIQRPNASIVIQGNISINFSFQELCRMDEEQQKNVEYAYIGH